MVPKLKSRQIYLKLCTPVSLKVLNTNLTLYLKSKLSDVGAKIMISSDLLENVLINLIITMVKKVQ